MQAENRQEEQQWTSVVASVCFDVGACSQPQKAKSHLVVSGLTELKEQHTASSKARCRCFMCSETQAALCKAQFLLGEVQSPRVPLLVVFQFSWLPNLLPTQTLPPQNKQTPAFPGRDPAWWLFNTYILLMLIPIISSRSKIHFNWFQVLETKNMNYWEYKDPTNGKEIMTLKTDLGDRTSDGHWGNWDAMLLQTTPI